MRSVFMAFGLFLCVLTSPTYAQAVVEKIDKCDYGLDVGYTEETIKTRVLFTTGFFSKTETQVEISGVLWMPCGKSHPKPYPLMIFSHGSQDGGLQPIRAGFGQIARMFVENGIAVFVPIRKGFNREGTPRSEVHVESAEPISCNLENMAVGLQSAVSDTKALFNALMMSVRKEDLDYTKITLMGFSRGGVLALALAADGLPGVTRVFNFVGGWAGERCDNGFLSMKFEEFGKKIRVPVFSFYGDRDTYYSESFSRSRVQLLEKGGTPSTYHLIPGGTHGLMYTHWSTWQPIVFKK